MKQVLATMIALIGSGILGADMYFCFLGKFTSDEASGFAFVGIFFVIAALVRSVLD